MADSAPAPAASYSYADLWESVWPLVADRTALVCGPQRRTYAELAERANRLGNHLREAGIGPGDHVGLFLRNDCAYLEAMIAAFSLRAVPVNMNHRYTGAELQYLIDDSGTKALLVHQTVTAAVEALPKGYGDMCTVLVVDDPDPSAVDGEEVPLEGSVRYEDALAAASAEPVHADGRSGDDTYLMYTGGTTGMPKGVVWRQEDAFFALAGGGDPSRMGTPIASPGELQDRIIEGFSYFPLAPMMHAAAQWTTWAWLFTGGKTTLLPGRLDPEAVWQAVEDEGVNALTVVGDAVGRPIAAAWEAEPDRWDASTLMAIGNGGAPMSASLKEHLAELFQGRSISDGFGSSEAGIQGAQRVEAGQPVGAMARFTPGPLTGVFDDEFRPIEPGSGAIGRVANSGRLPLGYLNDPDKTAATFVEVDGKRYCFTGDMATVEIDGTVQLLGRGSGCINTGGEKVFPEEVEAAIVDHPAVTDVLVVGTPDERWGSAVTAIVAPASPDAPPSLEELRDHLRASLAGYKLPKHLVLVPEVKRSPAGKADYRWAKATAEASVPAG